MKKINDIESQVQQALNSLEGIKQASTGSFFFTRVQARMNRTELSFLEKMGSIISRPAVALAAIGLIIMINSIAIVQQKQSTNSLTDQSELVSADEYNMAVNSFYDYENSEP